MDELCDLVRDTVVVGRNPQARPVCLPTPFTEVARPDARSWDVQLAQDHPSGFSAVVDAWWSAVDEPGELVTTQVHHQRGDREWHAVEVGHLNLLHQPSIGCIVTYARPLGPTDPPPEPEDPDRARYAAPLVVIQYLDEIGIVLRTEGDAEQVFGITAEELQDTSITERLHPDDRDEALAMWLEVLASPDTARTIQHRVARPDGSALWIQSTVVNRLATDGAVLVISQDISARRAQEAALATSEQELRFLTDVVPVGVFRTDAHDIVTFSNARWASLVGEATSLSDVVALLHPDDRDELRATHDAARASASVAIARVRTEADDRHLEFRLQRVADPAETDDGGGGVIGTVDDVTGAVVRAIELQASVERDPLTGLANRRGLRRTLETAVGAGRDALVLFGDLDDFKQVNDEWGHAAGDRVLTVIGHRMRDAVRPGDVVGRWGGDEFLVICLDVPAGTEREVLGRLHGALAEPIDVGDGWYHAGVSLGAVRPGPGENSETVLRRADTAMYEAKRNRHRDKVGDAGTV